MGGQWAALPVAAEQTQAQAKERLDKKLRRADLSCNFTTLHSKSSKSCSSKEGSNFHLPNPGGNLLVQSWRRYMVFSCADSRVCPTLTFGLHPSEAFTVRNIASMVPAYDEIIRGSKDGSGSGSGRVPVGFGPDGGGGGSIFPPRVCGFGDPNCGEAGAGLVAI
ncbi:hypothetical protein E2562_034117 [Oryza meyeriana var. granulata]|uniref:Carbonic anhydrase n=1 Tax=Oryza meyeriana var. granulata TaxID=110450 RepID=A0A6G1E656_9ORYZ|nr:hypothetical protein E2562_034117 [Oryza meyeriana var. granulata]